MTEEKDIKTISDNNFHQWKKNDCTVALLKLLDNSIKRGEELVVNHILGGIDIDSNFLYSLRGETNSYRCLKSDILSKASLEESLNKEEESDE